MTTKIIGIKELRQNLSKITATATKRKQRYLVFKNSTPVFEINPVTKKDMERILFMESIRRAERDIRSGRVFTLEQIEKKFNVD